MGLIGWVFSWFIYWTGNFMGMLMNIPKMHWLYPAYNQLMVLSLRIQDATKCERGPWRY
jgi:hypothetical protein